MEEYTVRSTYTRAESAARRAADIAVILLLCFFLVFILFKVILVPVEVNDENVAELNTGELLLVDRVSRFIADYSVGDIVRADLGSGYAFYRVAAKGGSLYQVRNGKAYLDGELIDESAYGANGPNMPSSTAPFRRIRYCFCRINALRSPRWTVILSPTAVSTAKRVCASRR